MFDDSSDKDRRTQSLLALGGSGSRDAAPRPGSDVAEPTGADDRAARHRLARSRREAAPSPLVSALAQLDSFRPVLSAEENTGPAGARGPGATPPPIEPQPVSGEPPAGSAAGPAEARNPRWDFRNILSQRKQKERSSVDAGMASQPAAAAHMQAAPPEAAENVLPDQPPAPQPAPAYQARSEIGQGTANDLRWRPLIDPMRVIGGVVNSKMLIVAATAIGAAVGVAIALSTPKKYEAAAELLVDPRDLKVSDRDLTETGLTSDALLSLVENQVRVLTSGPVLTKVVDKLKLEDDPEFNGRGKSSGIGDIIGSLRALISGNKEGAGGGDLRRVMAVNHLADALSVERSGRTFVVTVGVKTENAEKSALIANTVTDVFLKTYGELQSDTAGRAADELTARLQELRAGVEEAERAAEKFRAEHDLIGAQGRLISDDELIRLNDQLSIARARTIELNARAASARSVNLDSVIGGGLPEELSSSVMSELRSQYAAIRQQSDQLSVRLGPRHPQYLAMQAQLQGAREQIAEELKRIVATVQTDLKRAVQLEQDLAARLAQLKVRSGDVNGDMVTLRELEREVAAKRTVYENFLLRAKEAGEQRDINIANISVISQAYPPLDPTGPSRASISIAGSMVGFIAGIGLGVGRGILWSLRDSKRARRRRLTPPTTPAGGGPRGSGRPFAENDGAGAYDDGMSPVPPEEAAAAKLARLAQMVRTAAQPPTRDGDRAERARPAETQPSSVDDPRLKTPGANAAAKQDPPAMYPYPPQNAAYPQHPQPTAHPQPMTYGQAPMQPSPVQAAPYAGQPAPYLQPPLYPPHFAPQPVGYPYPAAAMPQAMPAWQPQFPHPAAPAPYYGYPQPSGAAYAGYPQMPQPAPYPQEARPAPQPVAYPHEVRQHAQPAEAHSPAPTREMSPIEEVRESLREFREAIRDLAEERARRKAS